VQKRIFACVCAFVLAAVAAGCSQNSDTTANSSNAASNMTAQTRAGLDNTEITTETSNGVTTETRTFKDPNSRVERVVVTTRDGKRTARVYYRDKTERDLNDNEVESALNATGDALVKTGSVVGDKAEDVGSATVNGAKKVGSEVGDKAEDVGGATVNGAKKVGSEVGDKAEDVGGATVNGAKKVGKATAKGAKKVGSKIKGAVTP
jgi:ABC-type Fe3+-hydroxamate transport system substrate-binding protein